MGKSQASIGEYKGTTIFKKRKGAQIIDQKTLPQKQSQAPAWVLVTKPNGCSVLSLLAGHGGRERERQRDEPQTV
jgi:hypothetical protein